MPVDSTCGYRLELPVGLLVPKQWIMLVRWQRNHDEFAANLTVLAFGMAHCSVVLESSSLRANYVGLFETDGLAGVLSRFANFRTLVHPFIFVRCRRTWYFEVVGKDSGSTSDRESH